VFWAWSTRLCDEGDDDDDDDGDDDVFSEHNILTLNLTGITI
jgi:hypothetical protein